MSRFSVSGLAAAALLGAAEVEAGSVLQFGLSSEGATSPFNAGVSVLSSPLDSLGVSLYANGYSQFAPHNGNSNISQAIGGLNPFGIAPGGTLTSPYSDSTTSPGWMVGNSTGQPLTVYHGPRASPSDQERMEMIFGSGAVKTLGIRGEAEQLVSDDHLTTTSPNYPHNILDMRLSVPPVKLCLPSITSDDGCTADLTSPLASESDCKTRPGCVFTEVPQVVPGHANPVEVKCAASVECSDSNVNQAKCKAAMLAGIKEKYNAWAGSAMVVDGSSALSGCETPLDESTCADSTNGTAKDACELLTEFECKSTNKFVDTRYVTANTTSPFTSGSNSDTDIGEYVPTCYVKTAPSIASVAATWSADPRKSLKEAQTPLYANPQWPDVLGRSGLSVKTSALKGDTTSPGIERGDEYSTIVTGASGKAAQFAFDGYIPDMTYIRPEYDAARGGYHGFHDDNAELHWNLQKDIDDGYVTWLWNSHKGKYEAQKGSLVMHVTNADQTVSRRTIQPDPDAASRSQRQVSLDTMLQFADAIGITAVDNEQALYEWKLDALQTLLDRINTSHKATAFTYAATGHQLLNLLERFQAHSGATDDMLYYMVTVMNKIVGDLTTATSIMGSFAFEGSDDNAAEKSIWVGGQEITSPTDRQLNKSAIMPGDGGPTFPLLATPRPPKAYNPYWNADDNVYQNRVHHSRFVTNPSNDATVRSRLSSTALGVYDTAVSATSPITNAVGVSSPSYQVAAGNLDLRPNSSGKNPSKIKAILETAAFDPSYFRADGMNSRAAEYGNENQLHLNDISLGQAVSFDAGSAQDNNDGTFSLNGRNYVAQNEGIYRPQNTLLGLGPNHESSSPTEGAGFGTGN